MTKQRLILALGLCLVGCLARAEDVSNVARHAPANTCFAAASADVGGTCEAFQKTRLGEALCGPAFKPLIDELRRRELAGPLNLRPAFGFDWSDLAEVHDAGGLFIFPLADAKLGLAWIFMGTSSSASPSPLAAAQRYFTGKGYSRSTVRHKAGEMTLLKPAGSGKSESPRVLFVAQGFYGVANSREAAEALLAVQTDRSLATEAVWQQSNPATGAGPAPSVADATVVVRPMEFWELVRRNREEKKEEKKKAEPAQETDEKEDEDEEEKRDPLASARHLGFDGVQALAGRVSFSADENHDWQLQAVLLVPRPYEKALRLLELQQGPLPELPDWLAADITSASFWHWDFPLAMKGYGNLFDEANEPGPDGVGLFEDMLDGLRDDPEGVQVDLRRDVFEQLGPGVLSVTDRRGTRTKEMPNGDRTLYVTQVPDMARVIDALKRFYRGDELVRHVRSGNYDVWTVPEGSSLFIEGESDSVLFVRALAVGEGHMLFGTDVDLLNSAIATSPTGAQLKLNAAWSRLWQSVKERHGAGAALWVISRLDQVLEPAYQRATTDERSDTDGLAATLWRILLFGTADEEVEVPYAAVPPYDRLRAALPPASIVMSQAPDGFSITISALGGEKSP